MSGLSVKIDDTAFKAQAFKYQSLSGRSFKDVLTQQTGVLCKKLATTTNPFGNSGSGKKQGDKAVTKDVRKVYKTPATVYDLIRKAKIAKRASAQAKRNKKGQFKKQKNPAPQVADAFYRAYRRGSYGEAARILHSVKIPKYYTTEVGSFDGGQEHKGARHGSRRKVPDNTFAKLVTNDAQIKRYLDEKKGWVGLAKSGWAYCAGLLGKTGNIAGWILNADKGKSVGSVKFQGGMGGMDGKYEVSNKVTYAVPAALSRGGFAKAVEDARNNMYMFFVKANEALIRKAGMSK